MHFEQNDFSYLNLFIAYSNENLPTYSNNDEIPTTFCPLFD